MSKTLIAQDNNNEIITLISNLSFDFSGDITLVDDAGSRYTTYIQIQAGDSIQCNPKTPTFHWTTQGNPSRYFTAIGQSSPSITAKFKPEKWLILTKCKTYYLYNRSDAQHFTIPKSVSFSCFICGASVITSAIVLLNQFYRSINRNQQYLKKWMP